MLNTHLYQGQEYKMSIYNGKPIIGVGLVFLYYDECEPETELEYDFPDYISSYFKIYNERLGRVIKTIPLTRSGNVLYINSEDVDFEDNGDYFYEVGYIMSGGYEQVLRYGLLQVI